MPIREVNDATVDLIKSFEGIPDGDPSTVNLDPYLDPIGIWTIGWGHAISNGNAFLRGPANRAFAKSLYPGGLTQEQAEALLRSDLMDTGKDVLGVVAVDLVLSIRARLHARFPGHARTGAGRRPSRPPRDCRGFRLASECGPANKGRVRRR